ncbi:MAG: hypothetical protein ACOCRO_01100 [Halanaerobiales bacterium]
MRKNLEITKNELVKLYVEDNKTTYDIADIYNCDRKVISKFLKQYDIPNMDYKIKFSNNPVETYSKRNRVSFLKCFDANTLSSSSRKKIMV